MVETIRDDSPASRRHARMPAAAMSGPHGNFSYSPRCSHCVPFAPRDGGVRPVFQPPALSSEGAVRGCWSLGESQAVELVPAPHSSVAVRHRERRRQARLQGDRGVNGGDPRQRGAGRSCRARPLWPCVRRYGPRSRRTARRASGLRERSRDTGQRRPQAEAQTAVPERAKARAPISVHSRFVT